MADSYIIYTASGAQDTFSIPFGYLDPDHVSVSVDNVDATFTFPTGSQAQVSPMPTNGQKVKVYRTTPRTTRQVVWVNASNLTATDLNSSDLQLLYIAQEAFDLVADAILKDALGLFNADGIRITNVGTPTDLADAATKAYVDASTIDIVDDAEDARDAAVVAQLASEAALAACLTVYDNFDDRYLGQKSSAPTLDNDGNALLDGALYYNTVDNKMYVYDLGTTSWLPIETNIPDGIITTAKLANNAVTAAKLADGAVSTAAKVVDGILTYAKMAGAALASSADILAGTASKLVTAAALKTAFDTKFYQSGVFSLNSGDVADITVGLANARRIEIDLYKISLTGTANPLIQVGTGGSPTTTGYGGAASRALTSTLATADSTTGFTVANASATFEASGTITLKRIGATNKWVASGVLGAGLASGQVYTLGGDISLAGALDIVRITNTNTGTDDFDGVGEYSYTVEY